MNSVIMMSNFEIHNIRPRTGETGEIDPSLNGSTNTSNLQGL